MRKAQGISHIAFKYLFEILAQKYCLLLLQRLGSNFKQFLGFIGFLAN